MGVTLLAQWLVWAAAVPAAERVTVVFSMGPGLQGGPADAAQAWLTEEVARRVPRTWTVQVPADQLAGCVPVVPSGDSQALWRVASACQAAEAVAARLDRQDGGYVISVMRVKAPAGELVRRSRVVTASLEAEHLQPALSRAVAGVFDGTAPSQVDQVWKWVDLGVAAGVVTGATALWVVVSVVTVAFLLAAGPLRAGLQPR